jgi:hypothetical protein
MRPIPILISALLAITLLSSCAASGQGGGLIHGGFMRGQVVRITSAETIVCIGSSDGASVGQELTVYRYLDPQPMEGADFVREDVGVVEVTEILDAHFARVRLVDGKIEKYDIVETVGSRR